MSPAVLVLLMTVLVLLHRSHSRLQNIEFECWVFKDKLPLEPKLTDMGIEADTAFYGRPAFDPKTLEPST